MSHSIAIGIVIGTAVLMGFYALQDIKASAPNGWASTKHLFPFLALVTAANILLRM